MIDEGSLSQALLFAQEMADTLNCTIKVTELDERCTPTTITDVVPRAKNVKVIVHGPNLKDQKKGSFHVHSADCADNKAEETHNWSDNPSTICVACREDVAEFIYVDVIAENPGTSAKDYLSDFWFAPCLKDLPKYQPKEDPRMGTTSMAPEPRTSNGETAPVESAIENSKVLSPEQQEELRQVKAKKASTTATGKRSSGKRTSAKPKDKADPTQEKPKAEAKETTTEVKKDKVTRSDLQKALIAIRPYIRIAADTEDLNTYIAEMDNIIAQANVAISVGQAMIVQLNA